jgi:predicted transcriptional regulator YheO
MEGNVSKRSVGAPITDMVFKLMNELGDDIPDRIGYKNTTADGKVLKCSTIFVRNDQGRLEGCLCINFDVTDFAFLSTGFSDFTFQSPSNNTAGGKHTELYATKFSETMESIIDTAIAEYGKLPAMMDKEDKLKIVRQLDKSGIFSIKGSIVYLAKVFGASKFTIYNYLNEVREG